MRKIVQPLLILLGYLFIVGEACPLDRVVLQLKWKHQFQFAGYYAAIAKGYYRDVGLDVELREAVPGNDPLEEVIHGRAQFGVGTSNVILARAKSAPIVLLAVIYQHSPFVLMASEASGVKDIHDLAEKSIMMEPDAAELLAYFQSEGVDTHKLKMLPHTFDVQDLISGKIAGMSAYSTDEPYHMKAADKGYLVFTPRAGGIDFYGDNLFTTEQEIQKYPERTRAFLEASLKGWEYAMAHPDEMIDLIQNQYNRGKSDEQLRFEARETARLVHPELIELGYINPGRWRDIELTYENLGMLPKGFSLEGFLYDRNPKLDFTWAYWLGGGILFIALVSFGWNALMWHLNQKLRREVKAREEAEAIAQAENTAKTHFYAILAHEVRTPLSGILSSFWLYKQTASQEERMELLEISENSAKGLLDLVDHILDHSKIESGHVQIDSVTVILPDFLAGICDAFQAAATARGISLSLNVAPSAPKIIATDSVKFRQILSNLISNAVKFTTSGDVCVSVAAEPLNEGWRLIVRVSDTGAGIAPEKLSRIFEPYAQADSSVTRSYGGTGLGLSISSRLAQLLGGDIKVESLPDQGSTFIVTILVGSGPRISGF